MTYQELVKAVYDGKSCYWSNKGYRIIKHFNEVALLFEANGYMCIVEEYAGSDSAYFID